MPYVLRGLMRQLCWQKLRAQSNATNAFCSCLFSYARAVYICRSIPNARQLRKVQLIECGPALPC